MELKQYQRIVMDNLRRYLTLVRKEGSYQQAYQAFWVEKGVSVGMGKMPGYQEDLPGVPHVCFKVPTGGGKTYLACNSLRPLLESLPQPRINAVVWLVPSESILDQTLKALKNPEHPYRMRLNTDFGARVEVYGKEEALMGQNFNPVTVSEQLSVFVLSYDSFRTSNAEGLRAYRENSAMQTFREMLPEPEKPIEGAEDTALFQIINQFNPVIIVDESHHAKSKLSIDMLRNFNPAFVLELTATPYKRSNVISYVEAATLKREHMVKLPVIVYNRENRNDVVADAIDLRGNLEEIASISQSAGGSYIRPIVLFQAEPRGREDAGTFEKLKEKLIKLRIPPEHIAIKTANINELKDIDLLSPECPIRYIITINALKEGWDCPFAYILATVANRTSQVDVEQVLGRVLRQPDAAQHSRQELNLSYVLTSSDNFAKTLEKVIEGLQEAGFSREDYRVGDARLKPGFAQEIQEEVVQDDFFDLIPEVIISSLEQRWQDSGSWKPLSGTQIMLAEAIKQAEQYTQALEAQNAYTSSEIPSALRNYVTQYPMQAKYRDQAEKIILPQFIRVTPDGIFSGGSRTLLDKENLLEGFTLRGQPYDIDFSASDANLYMIDIDEGRLVTAQLAAQEANIFKGMLHNSAPEKRADRCKQALMQQLEQINGVTQQDLRLYTDQIVDTMNKDQLTTLEKSIISASQQIKNRIYTLMTLHQEKTFDTWLEQGKILCEEHYILPTHQSPPNAVKTMAKSLYEGEHEMNTFERSVAEKLAALPNIIWWHRNPAMRGFRINGYVNHYPDLIALTRSGKVLVIETKADYNRNADDAKNKLHQGRRWQEKAGENFRFYMVVESKEMGSEGAFTLQSFMRMIEGS